MDNLGIYFLTWNVGTEKPEQDLHSLLGLDTNSEKDKVLHDFYVISLQEVKSQPLDMLVNMFFNDPWTSSFQKILEKRDYVKIKTIRLQGLVLSIFCLRRHLCNLRDMETGYTRTGFSGIWGNKGAVSIRLGLYGCSLCFVNAHLSAHDNKLTDRIEDYNNIVKDQEFHVKDQCHMFYHDYVFWMGDLNFRLIEEFDMSPQEIEDQIKKGNLKMLLEKDQLGEVRRNGLAFSEFTEMDPLFPPTFKFEIGSTDYDHKRKPAWTDRILYKVGTNNYENVTLKADQISYNCHSNYVQSDHRPVTAMFNVKVGVYYIGKPDMQDTATAVNQQVFSDYSERIVEFDPIDKWWENDENTAEYKMSQDRKTSGDWIGLYKEGFSSLDDYVSYVYVNEDSSPAVNSSRSPNRSAGIKPKQRYTVEFPTVPVYAHEKYRLIYFSQATSEVQSVLGVSAAFSVEKRESD